MESCGIPFYFCFLFCFFGFCFCFFLASFTHCNYFDTYLFCAHQSFSFCLFVCLLCLVLSGVLQRFRLFTYPPVDRHGQFLVWRGEFSCTLLNWTCTALSLKKDALVEQLDPLMFHGLCTKKESSLCGLISCSQSLKQTVSDLSISSFFYITNGCLTVERPFQTHFQSNCIILHLNLCSVTLSSLDLGSFKILPF